jgi:crotonobetainyl-CoA:carnitine CoA-transferase CaiB-like acyl-CoA transferase
MTIAGGIAAALYKRKATGAASVVDVSLLGLATFNLTPDVTASFLYEDQPIPTFGHDDAPNPLVGDYRTKDGRYITLMMLQGDRFFAEAMNLIGLGDLVADNRFADPASRFDNRGRLVALMDEAFSQRTLDEWKQILAPLSGAWGVVQAPGELSRDRAVVANGYIPTVTAMSGAPYELPVNPVQFDEQQVVPAGAPEHGQHTEEILLEAGVDWDRIEHYKKTGAVL